MAFSGTSFRTNWAIVVALSLYLGLVLLVRASSFPALHGDESYFGLAALDLAKHGLTSPHAANTYTGPVQTLWTALLFQIFGPSVATLRSSAWMANGLAWALWLAYRVRRGGARYALPWLVLLLASPALLLMARLAWEVSALQNLFITACFTSVVLADREAGPSRSALAAYLIAGWLGVSSHFIFATILLALFFAALGTTLRVAPERAAPWVRISGGAVALCGSLFVLKPRISPPHFAAHVGLYTAAWLIAPWLAWLLLQTPLAERWSLLFTQKTAKLVKRSYPYLAWISLGWFLASGLGLGLLDMMAGPAVYRGFAEIDLPLWSRIALYGTAVPVALLGLYEVYKVLRAPNPDLSEHWLALTLVAWPLCLLFTGTVKTSMRYYLPFYPVFLWFVANRCALGLASPWILRGSALLALSAGLLWIPIVEGVHGVPVKYRMGNRIENAQHYLPMLELREHVKNLKVCHFVGDHFLTSPLHFLARVEPYPCNEQLSLTLGYDLTRAPYWKAELSERPLP